MRRMPRYYAPKGLALPDHIAAVGSLVCLDGVGPDVSGGGVGGGRIAGGLYERSEAGWHATPAGWWVNLDGVVPQVLVRLQSDCRIVRWENVQGSEVDQAWRVPVLLMPEGRDANGDALAFVSALNDSWNGANWEIDPGMVDIQRRLLAVAHGIALAGTLEDDNRAIVELVVAILAIGHHVSMAEIVAARWLTRALYLRVLLAAAGLVIPEGGSDG